MGDSPAEMPVLLTIIILQTILELAGLFLFFRRSHLFPIRGRLPKLVGLTCGCFMAFSWLSLWQRLWPSQYPCILNLLQAHTIWLTAFNSILLRIWVLHFAYNATSAMTSLKSHSRDLRTLSMGNWYLLNKHRISPMYMARVTAILMTIELITPAVCLGVYPQMFSSMANGDCPTFASNVGAVLLTVAFCVLMYGFGRSLKKFHNDGFNIRRELQNVGWSGFVFVPGWLIVQYTPGIRNWNDNTFGLSTVVIMSGAFMVHIVSVFYPLFLSYQLEVSMATLSMDVEEMRSLDKFLQSPQGVADFQKFLATEFSVENLLFFLEIEAFRNAYKGNLIAPPPESKSPISSPRNMSFSNERGATRQNTINTMTQPISEEPPSQSGSGDDFTSSDALGTRGVMASPSFSQAPLVPTVSMSISQNSQAGGPSSPLPRTRSVSSNAYRQSFNQDLPTTPQPSVAAAPSTNRTRTTTASQYAVNVTFSNDVSIEEAARSIYYRYIRDHAPMQVNLPWHIRAALDFLELSEEVTETNSPRTDGDVPLSARHNPDIADRVGPFMFDEVQRSIFRLMETDSWLRYRKTESYHHLLQELRDKAATARLIMAVEK